MKLTIASKVTILRICLIPLFILSYYFFDGPGGLIIPTLIFVVAAMTDWIDGHLARSRNEVTNFGKFIDPIADKLLVTAAFILLVGDGRMSAVSCIIILSREFIISGLRLIAADNHVVIAASYLGKIKTTTQIIAIVLLLLNNFPFRFIGLPMDKVAEVVAVVFTIWSGVDYIVKNRQVLREKE